MKRRLLPFLALALLALALGGGWLASAAAPPLAVNWWSADGGAPETATGGGYALAGAVGQHDAGALTRLQWRVDGGVFGPPLSAPEPGDQVYVSPDAAGVTATGLAYEAGDILLHDTGTGAWTIIFDASAAGLAGADIDAFFLLAGGRIAMSFAAPTALPNPAIVADDSDLILYIPDIAFFFPLVDASDVALATDDEDVDAATVTQNFRVGVSTLGNYTTPTVSGDGGDIIRLDNPVFGPNTAGTWALHANLPIDIDGAWIDPTNGRLYISLPGNLGSFDDDDIIVCSPGCVVYWDGDAAGLGGPGVDGLHIAPATGAAPAEPLDLPEA